MAHNVNKTHKESLSFNERLGLFITNKIGTMGAAYLFMIIAFISLPSVIASHDALIIISWLAQTFLQLVLLPVIMVGQNIQSKHAELLADATYKTDIKAEKEIQEISQKLDILLKGRKP